MGADVDEGFGHHEALGIAVLALDPTQSENCTERLIVPPSAVNL